jgi:hypothetical protein
MNDLRNFQTESYITAREFSLFAFRVMERFHWTYQEFIETPLPVIYALIEYMNKK